MSKTPTTKKTSLSLLLAAFAITGLCALVLANTPAPAPAPAPEPEKKEEAGIDAPWKCECDCAKCPPKVPLSKNKDGEYRYRGCFKDADKNGKCDSSAAEGGRCRSDCVAATDDEKKKKVTRPPCAGCPCPANCAHCVFALAPKAE